MSLRQGTNVIAGGIQIDNTPTSSSSNAVSSGGVYTALLNKADVDLSNINSTGKATASHMSMPDFSRAVSASPGSASSPNTAASDGYISFSSPYVSQDRLLYIDGIQVAYTWAAQLGAIAPIAKGSSWYFIGSYNFLYFVPTKGD